MVHIGENCARTRSCDYAHSCSFRIRHDLKRVLNYAVVPGLFLWHDDGLRTEEETLPEAVPLSRVAEAPRWGLIM